MATLARLEKLFSALAAQDWARARAFALTIAADEEAHDHLPAAQRLRAALTPMPSATLVVDNRRFAADRALTTVEPTVRLDDLVLPATVRVGLQSVASEWRHKDRLAAAGVGRRSRVLLYGPPGCGKSVSAVALGMACDLPVHVVRLDAIVGSYLGETASRVHEIIKWASLQPSVLVFDEIDAIARRRGSLADVAELDRVVVALLQELEHTVPAGFLVATTNRLKDLDEALFRRFDLILQLPRPNKVTLERYALESAARKDVELPPAVRRKIRDAQSFADARRVVLDYVRERVLTSIKEP